MTDMEAQLAAALRLVRADMAMDPKKYDPATVKTVFHAYSAWSQRHKP